MDRLLGRYVIATNERGGRWRGRVERYTLWGKVEVACGSIDIGHGWHTLNPPERKLFYAGQLVPIEEVSDGETSRARGPG